MQVFLQSCHAVVYGHARGVLHRDHKPANVIVRARGDVLVLDWGMAGLLPPTGSVPGERNVASTEVAGTPAYVSLEQASGPLDERAHVWSLGAIPYELETTRLERILANLAGRAIEDHRMIGLGDRILVALSGGKDSQALLHVLEAGPSHRLLCPAGCGTRHTGGPRGCAGSSSSTATHGPAGAWQIRPSVPDPVER